MTDTGRIRIRMALVALPWLGGYFIANYRDDAGSATFCGLMLNWTALVEVTVMIRDDA